jgi:hypothetical protein
VADIIAVDIGGTWGDVALYDSPLATSPVSRERFAMCQVAADAD